MRRVLVGLTLFALVALARPAMAAGTVTVTSAQMRFGSGTFVRYTVAWTSSAGGAVSGNAFALAPGELVSVRFIPGGTTPDDLYDVTLAETSGASDLTGGEGADQSNSTAAIYSFDPRIVLDGTRTIDVVVANAGSAKTGTVVLFVKVQ